jgi:hypothetical protein
MLAGDHKGALAFDRPRQRAHVTLEFELVEDEPRAARGIGENGATILDLEPFDRDAFEVEAGFRHRPGRAAGAVEPGG